MQRLFVPKPGLSPEHARRLAAWRTLPDQDKTVPFSQTRLVVLDVETTGLNLATDSLISIGAVAVVNGRVSLGDSFSVVLQQGEASRKENILIHGISGSEQREGELPADGLLDFLEYAGKSPFVAFHVRFDETMIRRALRQYLGFTLNHYWLDLAYVMPALNPELMHTHRLLDDWAGYFNIQNEDRHNAVADAMVTGQLLMVAMAQMEQKHGSSYDNLRSLERNYRQSSML